MMMSMLGGLSESERQHVQQRTRASMDAQVLNEGRHQGGRPPYGYLVVDGPPHPNPNRAADGLRLRILSLDAATAPVVQRIFGHYIAGRGDKAIAVELNRGEYPVSVGVSSRPEPAPVPRRVAGQYGRCDSPEPALHPVRGVRAVAETRGVARPR